MFGGTCTVADDTLHAGAFSDICAWLHLTITVETRAHPAGMHHLQELDRCVDAYPRHELTTVPVCYR